DYYCEAWDDSLSSPLF
nr:immunoglobulin light chain junction region [Macaca mulatta]MOV97858.1 immunoglobulin light chain junction region [Macaca mulatta]MOV98814.1 immunoglobulin light chain junction region [Macaca mulatta]MOX23263.1 immunoglobulin light chain junction region [Macaca mulatta]